MYGSRLSGANQVAPDGASVITASWPSRSAAISMNNTTQESVRCAVFCLSTDGGHFDLVPFRSQTQASNRSCWNCKDASLPPPPLPPPQPPQAEFPSNRARIVSRHLGTRLELPIEAADHSASSSPFPSPSPRISCTSVPSTVASNSSAAGPSGNGLGSVLPDLSIPRSSSQQLSDRKPSGSERNCSDDTTFPRDDPRWAQPIVTHEHTPIRNPTAKLSL